MVIFHSYVSLPEGIYTTSNEPLPTHRQAFSPSVAKPAGLQHKKLKIPKPETSHRYGKHVKTCQWEIIFEKNGSS